MWNLIIYMWGFKMLASDLIKHLQKAIEEHGDELVWVDCTKEGLSTESKGVYFDRTFEVIRIGDEDFDEIEEYVQEEGKECSYQIIELR